MLPSGDSGEVEAIQEIEALQEIFAKRECEA
jgi:hypothetical protein